MQNFAFRMAALSLFFSYITFSIVYIFARRLGGWRLSWAACFFLSILPVSMGYDTWIKRDSLAICLGYAALLFIYKRKYILSAFLLSLSLLSKETASFFILAGSITLIFSHEKHKMKGYGAVEKSFQAGGFSAFEGLDALLSPESKNEGNG